MQVLIFGIDNKAKGSSILFFFILCKQRIGKLPIRKTLARVAAYDDSKTCKGGSLFVGVGLPHLAAFLQNRSWWKVKKGYDDSLNSLKKKIVLLSTIKRFIFENSVTL